MKNLAGKTLIFYTFQSSEHRRTSKPLDYNLTTFKKGSPQDPKIRDVLHELPLDFYNNSYHFRFRSEFSQGDEKIVAWIDISNLLAKVPVISNAIYVKVLELPSDKENKLFSRDKLRAIGLLEPAGKVNPSPTQTQKTIEKPKQTETRKTVQSEKNIFDLEIESPSKKTPTATPVQPTGKFVPGSQTTEQKVQDYKELLKAQGQRENLQKQAKKVHEDKVNQWGYSGHKTINNLTTLLATLHSIWPQWKPLSLSDLLKPEDVRKHLKKAWLSVHPDRNNNKDYETRYLAKRIFELINQANKEAEKNASTGNTN